MSFSDEDNPVLDWIIGLVPIVCMIVVAIAWFATRGNCHDRQKVLAAEPPAGKNGIAVYDCASLENFTLGMSCRIYDAQTKRHFLFVYSEGAGAVVPDEQQ